jgi:hypothetical protein
MKIFCHDECKLRTHTCIVTRKLSCAATMDNLPVHTMIPTHMMIPKDDNQVVSNKSQHLFSVMEKSSRKEKANTPAVVSFVLLVIILLVVSMLLACPSRPVGEPLMHTWSYYKWFPALSAGRGGELPNAINAGVYK